MFQQIKHASAIAVGHLYQGLRGIGINVQICKFRQLQGFVYQLLQIGCLQRFEGIDLSAAEQGGIDFKRWVFGGGAYEGEQAVFHIG